MGQDGWMGGWMDVWMDGYFCSGAPDPRRALSQIHFIILNLSPVSQCESGRCDSCPGQSEEVSGGRGGACEARLDGGERGGIVVQKLCLCEERAPSPACASTPLETSGWCLLSRLSSSSSSS